MTSEPATQPLSLRERNKLEKLVRIQAAAKQLFSVHGFDRTTTREIAKAAGVGLSTLFLYATDKRDLLFLAYNEDLEQLTEDAFSDCPSELPLLERLCICFRYFYIYYAKNPQVSRDLLRELTFYNEGMQSERFQNNRSKNIRLIKQMVEEDLQKQSATTSYDSAVIAETIFYLFASHIRKWLASDTPSPESGTQALSRHISILITGMSAAESS